MKWGLGGLAFTFSRWGPIKLKRVQSLCVSTLLVNKKGTLCVLKMPFLAINYKLLKLIAVSLYGNYTHRVSVTRLTHGYTKSYY